MSSLVVRAYECWPKDRRQFGRVINSVSASKARYQYWLELSDAWPDYKLIDMRSRLLGAAVSPPEFLRCAKNRGLPGVRCGDSVKVGDDDGVIVGHNSSANFNVLFQSGQYTGQTLNVHPAGITYGVRS